MVLPAHKPPICFLFFYFFQFINVVHKWIKIPLEHNSLSHFFDFDGNFFLLLVSFTNEMKYRQFVFLFPIHSIIGWPIDDSSFLCCVTHTHTQHTQRLICWQQTHCCNSHHLYFDIVYV